METYIYTNGQDKKLLFISEVIDDLNNLSDLMDDMICQFRQDAPLMNTKEGELFEKMLQYFKIVGVKGLRRISQDLKEADKKTEGKESDGWWD